MQQQHSTLYVASWIVLGTMFTVLTIALGYVTRQWALEGAPWGIAWIVLAAGVFGIGSIALIEVLNAGERPATRTRQLKAVRPYAR